MTTITQKLSATRQRIRNLEHKHYTHTRAAQQAHDDAAVAIRSEWNKAELVEQELRMERSKESLLLELREKESC